MNIKTTATASLIFLSYLLIVINIPSFDHFFTLTPVCKKKEKRKKLALADDFKHPQMRMSETHRKYNFWLLNSET